ncbi:HNH endonuclease signature motif containing protein [Thalassotalea sp. G2M2-11]|uniref:HNH endonuclease n=1 Tax=Thalassotalea sp. G2M2-11 TaxID=2787627 RepID=UPI0019D06174|nr:HNH endonuclease signature motif containing protein [Thalassotalea sp. G2M2-11]
MSKIKDELIATGDWSEEQAQLAVEFNFECAYCDKNLISSVDSHREWQTDHIVPSSANGKDIPENYALSCRTCNTIKHIWNPLEAYTGKGAPSKNELIKIARSYVHTVRAKEQSDLDKYLKIIAQYS